jgi:hypothetical protein
MLNSKKSKEGNNEIDRHSARIKYCPKCGLTNIFGFLVFLNFGHFGNAKNTATRGR